jgi:cation diffusion facilitator family transporter
MGLKFLAYYLTGSVAILSDALESIINVTAGAFALFSIHYASKPRDHDHPYGHGKIENISAGFEGALIFIAGIFVIEKSIHNFFHPASIGRLDAGLLLSAFAGAFNFGMGYYLVRKGKKLHSMIMEADGKHLISDGVSSAGLIIGLLAMLLTGYSWIDSIVAIVFGVLIIWTGYKLMKQAIFNLLDKTDVAKLEELTRILEENRRPRWIDVHNLRILKYGSHLHIDAHLTLPWYLTLEEAHTEMKAMEDVVKEKLGTEVELFVHPDPCLEESCSVCTIANCEVRKSPLVKKLSWELGNLLPDEKHSAKK